MTDKQQAVIIFNAGSSSLKFGLYAIHDNKPACMTQGEIENLGNESPDNQAKFSVYGSNTPTQLLALTTHEQAITCILERVEKDYPQLQLAGAGHRVVHGGCKFSTPVLINTRIRQQLQDYSHLAPLHMPHNLAAIDALQQQRPELQQVACFDTAFHRTMPDYEQHYALPPVWFERGVQHYGFHGLSYEYIASVLPEYAGSSADAKVIVAHLGHGASLCAMVQRKSVATTMGFTPLDGIPMATRPGALDPGVISWLIREAGLSIEQVDELLNQQCGLYGLSGISGDMRKLLADKHTEASRAIDYFVHHTQRAIASLAAAIGGIDVLVFTAGIGENSALIRERICRQAAWLGIQIDTDANNNNHRQISSASSNVTILRIPTDEEMIIAKHTLRLITQL